MARIYLASSWRNPYHAEIMDVLARMGHRIYNFKGTTPHMAGGPVPTAFSWTEMSADWQHWTPKAYRNHVTTHPRAANGYLGDFRGMEWADTCVLLLPAGKSAHIEAGYMKGRGKRLVVYFPPEHDFGSTAGTFDPDLMYLLADHIAVTRGELMAVL